MSAGYNRGFTVLPSKFWRMTSANNWMSQSGALEGPAFFINLKNTLFKNQIVLFSERNVIADYKI